MCPPDDFSSDAILPDGVAMLDEVLKQMLADKHLSSDSEEAENLAKRLIFLYQTGVREKRLLQKMLKAA
ncbi:hypothetical protein I6F15_24320 [Bradyrhizobium sp. BRP14]|nr:hypothetical protein [Bradyrhizobium sp. BRP14]